MKVNWTGSPDASRAMKTVRQPVATEMLPYGWLETERMVERAVLVVSAEGTTQTILLMAACMLNCVRIGSCEAEEDETLAMTNGTIMGRR